MEQVQDHDLVKMKELLRHAGEFIAYFELAETKMVEWRQNLESQHQSQHLRTEQALQNVHHELEVLQNVLTQAGLARLRLSSEQALKQGEEHLALLNNTAQQLLNQLTEQRQSFAQMIEQSIIQMQEHTTEAIHRIDTNLAKYDIQHFHRAANESCEQVEKAATNAVHKSHRLLNHFHWRVVGLSLITTLVAVFAIGLYINNEMPWELHQQAKTEREAGKLLLQAWSSLTPDEKAKLLHHDNYQKN